MTEVDPAEAPALLHRHNLLVAGRKGEMTPSEAEAQVLAHGLESFASEWQHERDMTAHSTWWLPVAVLFYAWQDLPATRREYERFVVWGRALWRDPKSAVMRLSLDEAETKLREDLVAGLVRGFGTNVDRELVPIPREEWRDLQFAQDISLTASRDDGTIAYAGVFVLRHEVVPLWMQEFATAGAAVQSVPRERAEQTAPKRGRKPDPEVDRFWIEIVKATSTGQHESQKALIDHMWAWAGQNDCKYDPETIRKKVGSLYREMGWRDGAAD